MIHFETEKNSEFYTNDEIMISRYFLRNISKNLTIGGKIIF